MEGLTSTPRTIVNYPQISFQQDMSFLLLQQQMPCANFFFFSSPSMDLYLLEVERMLVAHNNGNKH